MQNQMTTMRASLIVLISAMLYGLLGFLGTHLINAGFSVSAMLFWRFFIAALWVLFWCFYKKEKIYPAAGSAKSFILTFLLAAVCYSGSSGFYFLASNLTGTGIAMVIFFSYPILVALFVWLFRQSQLNKYMLLTLAIMLVGLILLKGNTEKASLSIIGIVYAILAAASYALYVFGSKWTMQNNTTSGLTLIVCLSCAMVFLVIALITHSLMMPQHIEDWLYMLALGVVATAVPIQMMLVGLRHINPLNASLLTVLEPLVTLIIGVILLKETVTFLQMSGCFLLMLSAIVVQFQRD